MPFDAGDAPLTWEGEASEADYGRMAIRSASLPGCRVCLPHAWHAAEMFLYFWEEKGALA